MIDIKDSEGNVVHSLNGTEVECIMMKNTFKSYEDYQDWLAGQLSIKDNTGYVQSIFMGNDIPSPVFYKNCGDGQLVKGQSLVKITLPN